MGTNSKVDMWKRWLLIHWTFRQTYQELYEVAVLLSCYSAAKQGQWTKFFLWHKLFRWAYTLILTGISLQFQWESCLLFIPFLWTWPWYICSHNQQLTLIFTWNVSNRSLKSCTHHRVIKFSTIQLHFTFHESEIVLKSPIANIRSLWARLGASNLHIY